MMKNKQIRISAGLTGVFFLAFAFLNSCSSAGDRPVELNSEGDFIVEIEAGEAWMHDFKVFPCFKRKNPPQYAVWIEDADGNYLETIAVTKKLAKEKWIFNGGNRRVEALPCWTHRRGVLYSDGIMLPNSDEPMPDAVTAASAKGSQTLGFSSKVIEEVEKLRIFAEFNHSTDFNSTWPKDAAPGSPGYSGGEYGSGQPAVVYSAEFSPSELLSGGVNLQLAGRSSADGSDGRIYADFEGMTTALNIVASVTLSLNRK